MFKFFENTTEFPTSNEVAHTKRMVLHTGNNAMYLTGNCIFVTFSGKVV